MKTVKAAIFQLLLAALALLFVTVAPAQVLLSEDFTGATTSVNGSGVGNWLFYNGACLTAGTSTSTTPPATSIPACTTVLGTYYNIANIGGVSQKVSDPYLVGGANGFLGGSSAPGSVSAQQADPVGQGALRFTNGSQNGSYGYGERGSIVSTSAYSSGSGITVTFKTVTYHGNGGGNGSKVTGANGNDGADGMSFFMLDGCMPVSGANMPTGCATNTIYTGTTGNTYSGTFPAIGATGGSLAYSCSNSNTPYDGLVGAYLGVGIDEFGNFLNGTALSLTSQSGLASGVTPAASGDNTATGGGLYANRIGIRGAGAVAWQALNNAYGVNPNNTSLPYYPASLQTWCSTGVYDSTKGKCETCPTNGSYNGTGSGTCQVTTTTATSNCPANPSGNTYTYDSALDSNNSTSATPCVECPTVATYTPSGTTGVVGTCVTTTTTTTGITETNPTGGSTCASGYNFTGTNSGAIPYADQCEQCPSAATYSATFSTTYPYGYCTTTKSSSPTLTSASNTTTATPKFKAFSGNSSNCPNGYTATTLSTANYQCEECTNGTYNVADTSSSTYGSCEITPTCPSGYSASGVYSSGNQCAKCSSGTYTASGTTGVVGSCVTSTNSAPSAATYPTGGSTCAKNYSLATQVGGYPPYASQCVECPTGYSGGFTASGSSTSPYGSCSNPTSTTPVAEVAAVTKTTLSTQNATPSSSTNYALTAVSNTCSTGKLYNYSTPSNPVSAGNASLTNTGNTAGILDYPALASAILSGVSIANESATTRGQATPIYYNLTITSAGLLSLSYAVNGSPSYTAVISNQSITSSNGTLPSFVRFGFAGSTGGSTNVHEVLCFKAAPEVQSAGSAAANQRPAGKVETGSYAYFASYAQINSSYIGHLTANALSTASDGSLVVATTPIWDDFCVLTGAVSTQCATGVTTGVQPWSTTATCTAATAPSGTCSSMSPRVIATWNGSQGVPFEWASLSSTQQATLMVGDPSTATSSGTAGSDRLNFLRGDRSQEINSSASCPQLSTYGMACFRDRASVLADIADSSPTWVGPPSLSYTATWADRLYSVTAPENGGTQNYSQFVTAEQARTNIVYVGANDGMLHGFRSGANNSSGSFNTSAPNDGEEVIAYMPGAVLSSAASANSAGCPSPVPAPMAVTLSVAQNIHGVSPAAGTGSNCTAPSLDYSNTQYGHSFTVDATPGTGDLFYNGTWHSWLVGGLGAGGAAIFALDITDPVTAESTASSPEAGAASLVMGEWTATTLSCVNNPADGNVCGANLGNTYGTPIIRRLHDGKWAIIFGNGFGSGTGDAGIFVMTITGTGTGDGITTSTYYISTGTGSPSSPNGIAYVASADLDQDHVTDYVYAGDLQGNVWRFDLTSQSETTWTTTTPFKLFTTPSGQPITTAIIPASGPTPAGASTIMLAFGTGQRNQFTNLGGATYASGTQYIYGVWDWNMSAWNAKGSTQYAALTTSQMSSYGVASSVLAASNLAAQVATTATDSGTGTGAVNISTVNTVCWAGSSGCTSSGSAQFGWYMNLPSTGEQILYNPELYQGVFLVNSTIPAIDAPLSCNITSDTGYSYAINILSGFAVPNFFTGTPYSKYADTQAAGEETNATGTSLIVQTAGGTTYMIAPTTSAGAAGSGSASGGAAASGGSITSTAQTGGTVSTPFKAPTNNVATRLTWVQLR